MAGDVQEPFSLSFQVDSLHSGSISFGRFEVESLSWERRSSFSHNRYLEEVAKYARQGSVTEKKAYFEAHFKRRALFRQASLDSSQINTEGSTTQNSFVDSDDCEEGVSDNRGSWSQKQEEAYHCNDELRNDESPKSSCNDEDSSREDQEVEFDERHNGFNSTGTDEGGEYEEEPKSALNDVDRVENVIICCDADETFKTGDENDYVQIEVEAKSNEEDLDVRKEAHLSHPTEVAGSGLEVLPTHAPKLNAVETTRSSGIKTRSRRNVSPVTSKPEEKKVISRSTSYKEMSNQVRAKQTKSTGSSLQSSLRIPKKEKSPSLKVKPSQENNRSETELKPKRVVTLQPTTPERAESRGHSCAARKKHVASTSKEVKRSAKIALTSKEIHQSARTSSLRHGESREKTIEEKKEIKIRQVARDFNLKANPTASVPGDSFARGSDGFKSRAVSNSIRLSKTPIESNSKSEGQHISSGRRNGEVDTDEVHGTSSNRNQAMRASQRRELLQKKLENKEPEGKKHRLTERTQAMKGRTIEARQKVGTARTGKAIVRKNAGHLLVTVAY